jgi:hypothetical protein
MCERAKKAADEATKTDGGWSESFNGKRTLSITSVEQLRSVMKGRGGGL